MYSAMVVEAPISKGPLTWPVNSEMRASISAVMIENAFGIVERQFTRRGQGNLAVRAFKQTGIEMFFELLDLEGHRRLGHEQQFRRLGKRQLFGNGVENLKAAISHKQTQNQ
jgi:hypothetical protein